MKDLNPEPAITAPADPEVTVTLPLSSWQVVMKHLGRGSFDDVAMIIYRLGEQVVPQIQAAQADVRAKAQEPGPDHATAAQTLN